uniref:Transposase MuDR plant domain-containing protein n=1 Tax=Lactuca sativa TaxID=4236 RepID=A0A9R1WVR6_LACSA|nr:hypothetical protein LSAT_V11C800418130 [Lactuca sativa]
MIRYELKSTINIALSSRGMYVSIDFHYKGIFSPNPLVYLAPVKTIVRDVDFGGFMDKEFLLWLTKLTKGACDNVYYCIRKESLGYGIRRIDIDADYWEFVEIVYSLESELNVYIDHQNEPILDWTNNELLVDGKGYESNELDEEEYKNYELSKTMEYEHECDEEVHTFDKIVGYPFLDKLSKHISDDEEEANNGKDKDVFPIHNENQEWEKMVLVLGMKFSNPLESKLCVTNYAVKMDMIYGMKKVIIKGYWKIIVKKPKMSVRKLKAKFNKKFNLITSVEQCINTRKYAFQEIEGYLKEHYAKTWSYEKEIKRTNLGSTVKMDVDVMLDGTTYFSKFCVCFKRLKGGWIEGCRKVEMQTTIYILLIGLL